VAVRVGIGVVQGLAADRAEAGAVRAAERLGGQGEDERIVCPVADVHVPVPDVRAPQLLVGRGLVHLASVDPELGVGRLQTADAGTGQLAREAQPERVTAARPGDVEVGLPAPADGLVGLPAELDRVELDLEIERPGLPGGEGEPLEIDDSAFRIHSLRG
jgi:hypothetical protein